MILKTGSLFSGIGGIEYGLERTGGFKTMWFVENDKYAQAVLKKHWPETPIYGDIKRIDFRSLSRVDVLTGGFPCQDISNAGKRAGIKGSRSSLWKYYCEAIRILRPKYVIVENVAALVNRGLDVVLGDLAQIGYDAEWYNISASAVGALHRRERIFIIAYPSDTDNNDDGFQCAESIRKKITDVADTDSGGLERTSEEGRNIRNVERISYNGWWAVEPELGRVAYGVPNRVDRIKCLGNAVVPACAEAIGKAILKKNES